VLLHPQEHCRRLPSGEHPFGGHLAIWSHACGTLVIQEHDSIRHAELEGKTLSVVPNRADGDIRLEHKDGMTVNGQKRDSVIRLHANN